MVCKTWAVGFLSKAGIAELLPSIVIASKLFELWVMSFELSVWCFGVLVINQLKFIKTVKVIEVLLNSKQ